MAKFELIQFYYSSKVKPSDKYPCDNGGAKEVVEKLKTKGHSAEAIDIETIPDTFRIYHKACTGPDFKKRAVFGEVRGADYKEFFGKTIPALFLWEDANSRAPVEVFPRMDHDLNRMIFVNEALDKILGEKNDIHIEESEAEEDKLTEEI